MHFAMSHTEDVQFAFFYTVGREKQIRNFVECQSSSHLLLLVMCKCMMLILFGALILHDYERCKMSRNITVSKFHLEVSLYHSFQNEKQSCSHVQYVLLF